LFAPVRHPLALLLLAAALLAAGCGSSPSFKSSFASERAQFRQVGDNLGSELQAAARQTDAQVAAAFGSLAGQLTKVKSDLAALNAPGRYKAETAKLVAAFGGVLTEVRAIQHDAAVHDARRASSDTLALVQRASAVKALDTEISTQLGLSAPTG
jgi:hypothetical protein